MAKQEARASNGIVSALGAPEGELTFEQALSQLEGIVNAIEQGKIGLEEQIAQCEKGTRLLKHCRAILSQAEAKVQQLQLGADGKLTPGPLEGSDGQVADRPGA